MAEEGNKAAIIPGPEGPEGAQQQRRQLADAMARLSQPTQLSEGQKAEACIDDLKQWIEEQGIDASNLEELLVQDVIEARQEMNNRGVSSSANQEPSVDDSKTSLLIDLMAKNKLQNACGQEMITLFEQISLENNEQNCQTFPSELLSKQILSKGAQRNFDRLIQIFKKTETGPRADFVNEIETKINNVMLETLFYKTKTEQINLKIDGVLKPRFDAKLCLRDTLQSIYDLHIKNQAKELSLQSLKIQQETRQKLQNLRDAQKEANEAAAATGDSKEELEMSIAEIQTLAGQKQQIEDQIESMQKVIYKEFAGLDPDILKARKQVALLRDELIAKEEAQQARKQK